MKSEIRNLGECIELLTGYPFESKSYTDARGVRLLRGDNVMQGFVRWEDAKFWPEEKSKGLERYLLQTGDVVLAMDRTWVNAGLKCAVVRKYDVPSLLVQRVGRIRAQAGCSTGFIAQVLQSHRFIQHVKGTQTESAVPHISSQQIREFTAWFPPLPEQQKIADILGTWDEALEKLDALIAAKARRKQALMQQLLTGHRRLPGFSKPWKRVELSEVAEECSIRNGQKLDRSRLYAVTKAEGMVPMRENVQGATINRCQIVERGWFAYNPMRINIGSISRWERDDPVMVSPDYVVFRTKESLLLSDYLNHLRRAALWADFVGAAGNGSVRIRIWFDDLGYFEFPLPPIAEQRAIAAVLDTADAELRLLRRQRTALDHQKRGLIQQLLTGNIRTTPASK